MNFWPPAFNPTLGIAYGAGIEGCSDLTDEDDGSGDVPAGTSLPAAAPQLATVRRPARSSSFDVATGKQVAKLDRPYPNYAGVMTTPDLVWTGEMDGTFGAYDAKTLEQKWSINVGGTFSGPADRLQGRRQAVHRYRGRRQRSDHLRVSRARQPARGQRAVRVLALS